MSELGLTVNELYKECRKQILAGNGDKHIVITDDDECNGLHTLFYAFTEASEDNFSDFEELNHDSGHTYENTIVLG